MNDINSTIAFNTKQNEIKSLSDNSQSFASLPAVLSPKIRYSKKINALEKLMWSELDLRSSTKAYCKVDLKELAQSLNVKINTIVKALNKLKSLEMISIDCDAEKNSVKIWMKGLEPNLLKKSIKSEKDLICLQNSKNSKPKDTFSFDTVLPEGLDPKIWQKWLKHHKEKTKKNYTPTGLKMLLNSVEKLLAKGEDVNCMILYAIERNWMGFIFPQKKSNSEQEDNLAYIQKHGVYMNEIIFAPNSTLKVGEYNFKALNKNGKWELERLKLC